MEVMKSQKLSQEFERVRLFEPGGKPVKISLKSKRNSLNKGDKPGKKLKDNLTKTATGPN